MKAVRHHRYGDDSVLHLEEADRPKAGPGQVLVRVAGAAFNPVDAAIRAGYLRELFPLSFPHVPGFDLSGTVVEVGEAAGPWSPGDEVIGFLPMGEDGAAAEYAVAPGEILTAAPKRVQLAEAAALPSSGLTAWQAVYEHMRLRPGQRVLINGAGGAVGGFAVQLAHEVGATVVAVIGPDDAERVRRYGAAQVIDRTTQDVAAAVGEQVDALLNLAAVTPDAAAVLQGAVRAGGVYVTTVPGGPSAAAGDVRVVSMFVRSDAEQLAGLVSRVDAGRLQVWVKDTLPLGQLPSVHARSAAGSLRGKVVFVP